MIGPWMAYALAIGIGAGVAALAAERALWLLGRAQRWVWAASMAVSLAAPVALPIWSARPAPPVVSPGFVEMVATTESLPVPPVQPAVESIRWGALLDSALAWSWILMSLAGVALLAGSALSLQRMREGWRRRRVGGVQVLLSSTTGPAVVGCFAQAIVLPEWVLDLPADQQRLIVTHEREHAHARDPLLLAAARAAVVLAPWNLALWWQLRRLQLAVEVDCDRRVLAGPAKVESYGTLLLEVGLRSTRRFIPATAFSEPTSFLERRIRVMTAATPKRRGLQAAALALLLLSAPVALWAAPVISHPALARVAQRFAGAGEGEIAVRRPAESAGVEVGSVGSAPQAVERPFRIVALAADPARQATAGDTVPDGIGGYAFEVKELERLPELSNKGAIASIMERLYPRLLHDAGIGGVVVAQFVIEADGVPNMRTVKIVESDNEQLSAATLHVLERFRFRPGRARGENVRVQIMMPITWQPPAPAEVAAVGYARGAGGQEGASTTVRGYAFGASESSSREQEILERAKILVAQRYPALLAGTQFATTSLFVIVSPDGQIRESRLVRAGEDFAWPAGTPTNFRRVTTIRNAEALQFAPALVGAGLVWMEL